MTDLPVQAQSVFKTDSTEDTTSLTDEEIREVARGIVSGHIFIQTTQTLDLRCWPILSLLEPDDLEELNGRGYVAVWEWLANASAMAVNGEPVFLSARFLNRDSYDRVMGHYYHMHLALYGEPPWLEA